MSSARIRDLPPAEYSLDHGRTWRPMAYTDLPPGSGPDAVVYIIDAETPPSATIAPGLDAEGASVK